MDETIVKKAAIRHGRSGNLIELYLWFFRRLITAILAVLLTANFLYIYFFNPNGLAGLEYELIVTRWGNPLWGGLWRLFDWLLVVLAVSLTASIVSPWLVKFQKPAVIGKSINVILKLCYVFIVILAAQIIFGFSI